MTFENKDRFDEKNIYKEFEVGKKKYHLYCDTQSFKDKDIEVTYQKVEGNDCHIYVDKNMFEEVFDNESSYVDFSKAFTSIHSKWVFLPLFLMTIIYFTMMRFAPLYIINFRGLPEGYLLQLFMIVLIWILIITPVVYIWYYVINLTKTIPDISIGNIRHISNMELRRKYLRYIKQTGLSYQPDGVYRYDHQFKVRSFKRSIVLFVTLIFSVIIFADEYVDLLTDSRLSTYNANYRYFVENLVYNRDISYKVSTSKFKFIDELDGSIGSLEQGECNNICMFSRNFEVTYKLIDDDIERETIMLPYNIEEIEDGWHYGVNQDEVTISKKNNKYVYNFEDVTVLYEFVPTEDFFVILGAVDNQVHFVKLNLDGTYEVFPLQNNRYSTRLEYMEGAFYVYYNTYDDDRLLHIEKYDMDFNYVSEFFINIYDPTVHFYDNEIYISDNSYYSGITEYNVINLSNDLELINEDTFNKYNTRLKYHEEYVIINGPLGYVKIETLDGDLLLDGINCLECGEKYNYHSLYFDGRLLLVHNHNIDTTYVYEYQDKVTKSFLEYSVDSKEFFFSSSTILGMFGLSYYLFMLEKDKSERKKVDGNEKNTERD